MIGAVILQIVLIFLNAVFASAEIAVISMNDVKLKKMAEEGNRKAARLAALTAHPAKFLATIQVSITLAGFLGSAYAADHFAEPLVAALVGAGIPAPQEVLHSVCVLVITVVIAYFSIVLGELIPKRIAMQKAEQLALKVSGILYLSSRIFAPLVWLLTSSTNLILKLLHISAEQQEAVTEEEIRMLVSAGSEKGTIDEEENKMIQQVFELDDQQIDELCTHRKDVIGLGLEDSLQQWDSRIKKHRHDYYPVYRETLDDIVGVLDEKSYFRLKERSRDAIMRQAVRKPFFVPETMKADSLCRAMRQRGEYFAVVVDEYGGTTGIITIKDLVELLFGSLPDENGPDEDIVKLEDDCCLVKGKASLHELSDELDLVLEDENYDTFNGLVCDLLGGVPTEHTARRLETDFFEIEIREVKEFCVEKALIRKKAAQEEDGERKQYA